MKKLMRTFSLLLCFAMLLSYRPDFFITAQDSAELPERRDEYLIDEDFEDTSYDIKWVGSDNGDVPKGNLIINCDAPTAENGYIMEDSLKSGKLSGQIAVLTGAPKPGGDGVTLNDGDSFMYTLGRDGKIYNELLALSFHIKGIGTAFSLYDEGYETEVKKGDDQRELIRINTEVFRFAMTDKGLCVWARSEDDRANPRDTADSFLVRSGIDEADITIAADPVTGLFSVWCGSDELVANARLGTDDCSKLKYLKVEHSAQGSAVMSDVKIYYPTFSAFSALSLDRAALTLESLTWQNEDAVIDDIKLPVAGRAGSSIVWESSDSGVIAVNEESHRGIVTQNADGNRTAAVTATLRYNGMSDIVEPVTFELTVPKGASGELPDVKEVLCEESFEGNNTSTVWEHTPRTGQIYVKNERLYLKRKTTDADATKTYYYFDGGKQVKQGIYGFDCTIWNKAKTMTFRVEGASNKIFFTTLSVTPTRLTAKYRDEEGKDKTKSFEYSNRIGLRLLFNTQEERFSLWVNGALVIDNEKTQTADTAAGLKRIYMYVNDKTGTAQEVQIDDICLYEAYPLREYRVSKDMAWLEENKGRLTNENDPTLNFGMISEGLTLPERGEYGSYIDWTSSNSSVIKIENGNGAYRKGSVIPGTNTETVVLTAKFSADGAEYKDKDKIEIPFKVAPADTGDDSVTVARVADMLTPQELAPYESYEDASGTGVKRSLSLPREGLYGCSIKWSSDNQSYIDNVGRVTRPRFDEDDVTVTLTAEVSRGNASQKKQIPITVLKDKEFVDPNYMSDEEFFGSRDGDVWNPGKLDYESYAGLAKVEAAAKEGKYDLAKEELLTYFRGNRNVSVFSRPSRNTGWANMVADDFQHLQTTAYYKGSMMVGSEWGSYEASLKTSDLTAGATISFSVRAWYNEDSYAEFAKHSAQKELRPTLVLEIDGKEHKFSAIDSVTVRAGNYKDTNYSGDEYLRASNYGDFTGDGLWETYLKFDVGSVTSEHVSNARLILYGHSSAEQEKRMIVLYHNDNTWSGKTMTWGGITQLVYSYNGLGDRGDADSGLPDHNVYPMERWTTFVNANNSYGQISRFNCWPTIAYEYALSKDEEYAYKAIKIAGDFISTTGGFTSNNISNKGLGIFVPSWDDGSGKPLKRGGYDTTITGGTRAQNWTNALKVFVSSRYMTPDFLTATLKSLWDTADYLSCYYSGKSNWMNTEMQGLQAVASNIPEFKNSAGWTTLANKYLAAQLFNNTFADGSYVESSDAYGHGSLKAYIGIKRDLMLKDIDINELCSDFIDTEDSKKDIITDTFDERLKKFSLYQILLYAPDGMKIQYGDSAYGTRNVDTWDDVYKWYAKDDPQYAQELQYIATYGKYGAKPQWTSKMFEVAGITMMRGNWAKTSPYLFTNVRGGGAHGHRDYNSITLTGYGNTLLADSGYFEYDSTDTYRQYGVSTEAHNTVLINNTSQSTDYSSANNPAPHTGTIHAFATNDVFDYLQQSTPNNYDYGNHMRTITYLKSDLFIVSDRMVPKEGNVGNNNYKQIWHMYPEAYILGNTDAEKAQILAEIENGTRKIRSNFKKGGNVLLASADTELKQKDGWCAKLYSKVEDAPYIYFEAEESGTTCLNTVIMTMDQGKNDDVSVTTLDKTADKTALRLDIVQDSVKYEGYYLLTYDGKNGGSFGPYETDAEMAYVQLTQDGKLYRIIMRGGTFIKESKSGAYLFKAAQKQEELSIDFSGREALITGDANALAGAEMKAHDGMNGLYIGDKMYTYDLENGYVKNIGKGSVSGSDSTTEIKGVAGNTSQDSQGTASGGGGGGAGGSIVGETGEPNTDVGNNNGEAAENTPGNGTENAPLFGDTRNHWARNYIADLQDKEIINGDENGQFHPDNQVTRAEFIAMVTRSLKLDGADYTAEFSDVSPTDWYAQCVLQALSYGLISKDVSFRPNAPITREEMAKIISQAMKFGEKYDFSEAYLESYADREAISEWAEEYVSLVTQSGLMTGRDDGFCPRENSTRAEAATVISRMLSK